MPKKSSKKVPQFFFIGKELSRSYKDEHVIKVKCTRIKKSSSFISLFWPSWSPPCTACTYIPRSIAIFSQNIWLLLHFEGNFRFWYRKLMIGANVSDDQKNPIRPSSRAMYKHYQTASKVVTSTARDFRSCVSTLIHIIGYFMFNLLLRSQVSSL